MSKTRHDKSIKSSIGSVFVVHKTCFIIKILLKVIHPSPHTAWFGISKLLVPHCPLCKYIPEPGQIIATVSSRAKRILSKSSTIAREYICQHFCILPCKFCPIFQMSINISWDTRSLHVKCMVSRTKNLFLEDMDLL